MPNFRSGPEKDGRRRFAQGSISAFCRPVAFRAEEMENPATFQTNSSPWLIFDSVWTKSSQNEYDAAGETQENAVFQRGRLSFAHRETVSPMGDRFPCQKTERQMDAICVRRVSSEPNASLKTRGGHVDRICTPTGPGANALVGSRDYDGDCVRTSRRNLRRMR